jgi:long-chain acyl-CoA synthetase
VYRNTSPSRTIPALWRAAVRKHAERVAFLVEGAAGWRELTWTEAGRRSEELAAGFIALGVAPGDRVAVLSRTRVEWTLCDYALASIGAVTVPIYPTSSAVECAYILGNAGARAIVCEDAQLADKVRPAQVELEALEHLLTIEPHGGGPTLDELASSGRSLLAERPAAVEERAGTVREDDLLTIVYTSGTTGPPKGCLLTHRNYRAMTASVAQVPGLFETADVVLLYLPLAHTFGRLVQFVAPEIGFTIAFCPDIARLGQALVRVEPTLFPSVPRVFEKAYGSARRRIESSRPPSRRLAGWALTRGRRAAALRQEGRPLPRRLAAELAVADRLVLRHVRARFGRRLRFAISGGAPLPREVAEFFAAVGVLILEGYGLTEGTTAAAMNRPGQYRFGTVGPALPGCKIRIAADGEVLLRGEMVFAGYHGNEEATREAMTDDGWLRTGDLGALDADGFLTIVDRKKDIIVTAGGKNVSPQNIENALKRSRYISEALVVGDRRPYVVALLALDRSEVDQVARTDAEVHALVSQVVDDVNRDLGRTEQVRRFAILPRDFSTEHAELTPTLKLRRRVCEEHFRDEIDRLYGTPLTP